MYKCLKNEDKVYETKFGTAVVPKSCDYSVYWVKAGNKLHVLDVKDHLANPKSVGEGVCRLLNKGDIVLELE